MTANDNQQLIAAEPAGKSNGVRTPVKRHARIAALAEQCGVLATKIEQLAVSAARGEAVPRLID